MTTKQSLDLRLLDAETDVYEATYGPYSWRLVRDARGDWHEACAACAYGVRVRCASCGGTGIVRLASSRTGAVRTLTARARTMRAYANQQAHIARWAHAHADIAYGLARVRALNLMRLGTLTSLALAARERALTDAQTDLASTLLARHACALDENTVNA